MIIPVYLHCTEVKLLCKAACRNYSHQGAMQACVCVCVCVCVCARVCVWVGGCVCVRIGVKHPHRLPAPAVVIAETKTFAGRSCPATQEHQEPHDTWERPGPFSARKLELPWTCKDLALGGQWMSEYMKVSRCLYRGYVWIHSGTPETTWSFMGSCKQGWTNTPN